MLTETPQCFRCGWHEIKGRDPYAHLELAHAIPHSLGGPNTVENYALLCSECHRRAPNVGDLQCFWDWIAAHESDGDPFAWFAECFHAAVDALTPNEQKIVATWSPEEMIQRWRDAAEALGGITIVPRDGSSPGTVAALMKRRHEAQGNRVSVGDSTHRRHAPQVALRKRRPKALPASHGSTEPVMATTQPSRLARRSGKERIRIDQ
jgi:hypothetical protein